MVLALDTDAHGSAHHVALGHGSHAVRAGGDAVQGVGAVSGGDGVLVGQAGAVKELDGGGGDGVGAVCHGAEDGGKGAGSGGEGQVDVFLLKTLKVKTGAVLEPQKVLLDVGHRVITS